MNIILPCSFYYYLYNLKCIQALAITIQRDKHKTIKNEQRFPKCVIFFSIYKTLFWYLYLVNAFFWWNWFHGKIVKKSFPKKKFFCPYTRGALEYPWIRTPFFEWKKEVPSSWITTFDRKQYLVFIIIIYYCKNSGNK